MTGEGVRNQRRRAVALLAIALVYAVAAQGPEWLSPKDTAAFPSVRRIAAELAVPAARARARGRRDDDGARRRARQLGPAGERQTGHEGMGDRTRRGEGNRGVRESQLRRRGRRGHVVRVDPSPGAAASRRCAWATTAVPEPGWSGSRPASCRSRAARLPGDRRHAHGVVRQLGADTASAAHRSRSFRATTSSSSSVVAARRASSRSRSGTRTVAPPTS